MELCIKCAYDNCGYIYSPHFFITLTALKLETHPAVLMILAIVVTLITGSKLVSFPG
jgi:hypothetical protein